MENKVVYEVKLSKPVMRLATVLAVGLFANAAVFTFDFVKPAHANSYEISSSLNNLRSNQSFLVQMIDGLREGQNEILTRVNETYFSAIFQSQTLEDVEADLHHSIKVYCKR